MKLLLSVWNRTRRWQVARQMSSQLHIWLLKLHCAWFDQEARWEKQWIANCLTPAQKRESHPTEDSDILVATLFDILVAALWHTSSCTRWHTSSCTLWHPSSYFLWHTSSYSLWHTSSYTLWHTSSYTDILVATLWLSSYSLWHTTSYTAILVATLTY